MRVMFFTIGPDSEPSSRFRVYQFIEPLRKLGVEASVRPRVGRRYFEMGYGLRRPAAPIRAAWVAASAAVRPLRRARDLWQARHCDVLVFQKETLPRLLRPLVRALGIPVVYDLDDAIYVPASGKDGLGPVLRRIAERLTQRRSRLPSWLARCRVVLAGSPELARYARGHAARVEILPTVVDTDAYAPRPVRRSGTLTIGWVGAPANTGYLDPLRPVFREITRRFDCRILLLGPTDFDCPGARVETQPFRSYASREDETRDLRDLDIGILPLPDDPWAAGKCGLKAIQYMATGIPVVASPVGVNPDLIRDGECGFLATTTEEWIHHLATLLEDPDLRRQMGRAGRARAETHYSLNSAAPRLAHLLRTAANPPNANTFANHKTTETPAKPTT